ncbi:TPA: hypothetical protein RQN23_003784 [Aeromonas veronii]|nr:hypothetical protein [Aeromonas veronii]
MNIARLLELKDFFVDFELFLYGSTRFENGVDNFKGEIERFIRRYRKKYTYCKLKKRILDSYLSAIKNMDEELIIPQFTNAAKILSSTGVHASKMSHYRSDFKSLFDDFECHQVRVLLETIPDQVIPGPILFVGRSDWQTSFQGDADDAPLCEPMGFYTDWEPALVANLCFDHGYFVRMGSIDTRVALTSSCILNCFLLLPVASFKSGAFVMPEQLLQLHQLISD